MILTVQNIQEAMKGDNFWLVPDSTEAEIIKEATEKGYVVRLSHTQVQWKDEEAIEKVNYSVKKRVVNEKADVYSIDETFDTIDQMFESKIAKEMFEMYTNEIANKKRVLGKSFQKAYRIGNKIVYEVLLDEGFKILHELYVHSCLSSQGFATYTIAPELIFIVRMNYENTSSNRKQFAKQNINVTSIYNL